jgi:hypothetical protein
MAVILGLPTWFSTDRIALFLWFGHYGFACTGGTGICGGFGIWQSCRFVSDDYGANFTALTNGLPATLVFQLAATPDDELVFAATESGPYMYKKSDNQWYYMGGVTAPDETYWTVEYVPLRHALRFGTYGRGIWEFNICDANSPQVSAADFTPNVGSGYVTFQTSAQNAWNYLWNFGDGQSGTGQNPSIFIALLALTPSS